MAFSENPVHRFVNESMARYVRAASGDERQIVLFELEKTLRIINGLTENESTECASSAHTVLWALDPNNAPWASLGMTDLDRMMWESFGMGPAEASSWTKLEVDPGLAYFLSTNMVSSELYKLWCDFYRIGVTTSDAGRKSFLLEVMEFLGDKATTPSQSKPWLAVGITLREIAGWKKRGFTPKTAKQKIDAGISLAALGLDESFVPGTAYPKVLRMARDSGWVCVSQKKYRNHFFISFERGSDMIRVSFSQTGRLSRSESFGNVASYVSMKLRGSAYQYFGGVGMDVLKEILNAPASQ